MNLISLHIFLDSNFHKIYKEIHTDGTHEDAGTQLFTNRS